MNVVLLLYIYYLSIITKSTPNSTLSLLHITSTQPPHFETPFLIPLEMDQNVNSILSQFDALSVQSRRAVYVLTSPCYVLYVLHRRMD